MSEKQKTLKQKLKEKEHYHVPIGLEVNEALELFREWIQQKRDELGEMYIKTPIDELLEELK